MSDDVRPTYETKTDREKQYEVASELGARWNAEFQDLPHSYRIDYCAVRNEKIVAMVEVKIRSHFIQKYDTVMVSMSKWKELKQYEALGIPGIFAFRFADGIYHHRVKDYDAVPQWGGRTNMTRDSADVEPVVHIPITAWKKL